MLRVQMSPDLIAGHSRSILPVHQVKMRPKPFAARICARHLPLVYGWSHKSFIGSYWPLHGKDLQTPESSL